ncbi:hypothetical protein [Streptomyces sp. NPDC031705]|uniref:hypothetical protein n=1 Tax=Streptomyces sp. NPDC031705 TaxID=3155729 RepID=UPI0033D2C87A
MGTTESAEAATIHRVTVKGFLRVHDDSAVLAAGETKIRNFSKTFELKHSAPATSWLIPVCADGETLGELRIRLRLEDELVTSTVKLSLYEWEECDHTDLEDVATPNIRQLGNGGEVRYVLTAKNREPSDDNAHANFSVTHTFGAPTEPTNVTVTRQVDRLSGLRKVHITWGDTSADETGYEIQNIATPEQTRRVGPNREFYDWALPPRELQCFRVRALADPTPSDWSALVCA